MRTTIKTVPALTAITVTRWLIREEIPEFGGTMVEPLYRKLAELGVKPAGELIFVYESTGAERGMDCSIAIPVAETKGDPAPFHFKHYDVFHCVSAMYKGSMQGICEAWVEFDEEVGKQGLITRPEIRYREVYLKWVDFESPENITELQAGIQ